MSTVPQIQSTEDLLDLSVPLSELVLCASSAMDLMCFEVAHHNIRVAGIAASLAERMGLSDEHIDELVIAGTLHDIGAFSLQSRLDTLSFEAIHPDAHAAAGAALLATFQPFERVSKIVRHHHKAWDRGEAVYLNDIPLESFVLQLADRIAVQMHSSDTVLEDAQEIRHRIKTVSNSIFHPDMVDVFLQVSECESFWLSSVSPDIERILERKAKHLPLRLDTEMLFEFGRLITRFIDFRSRFTSVHSRGVAATAEALADLAGFSDNDRTLMRLAGYFHDLGKLVVPSEIIEKPSSLSIAERFNVKRHTFYTYRLLETVTRFETVKTWAAFHHERLDGTGYPFRHNEQELSQGARIMAVADVFTALTEDRPYRLGMSSVDALTQMREMATRHHLDSSLVKLAARNAGELARARVQAQTDALEEYAQFARSLGGHVD